MTFKTIHTRTSLVTLTQAEATGTPINITAMAVGAQQSHNDPIHHPRRPPHA
jgi:hypothetical protein